MQKIFAIGLSKTGTNSLVDALKHWGINLLHYPSYANINTPQNVDGMADIPTVRFYKDLDRKCPGSKFVYMIRDKEEWLDSCEKHLKRRPPSTLGKWGNENRLAVYGTLYFDREKFSQVYDIHDYDVRDYFKDREDDLLIINICAGEGWHELATFLGTEGQPVYYDDKGWMIKTPFPRSNTAPRKTQIIDAVYPYINEGDDWSLKYSLRALEENFFDLRQVWVVGDKPDWANDNLNVIQVPHNHGNLSCGDYRRNRDVCHKILTAALEPEMTKEFLYLADDHYILVPWTVDDFYSRDQLVREDLTSWTEDQKQDLNAWQVAVWSTYDKLRTEGCRGWSYETHTPKVLNKRALAEMFALFGYQDGMLIWHTAYFNMFPIEGRANLSEESSKKAGFYEPTDRETIDSRIRDAVFLNHNGNGLNENLKDAISSLFPQKSSFEKD